MTDAGVRPFSLRDLEAAARFCEAARALDPAIEPFAATLGELARGARAALDVWRVAERPDGGIAGIAFAAVRESGSPPSLDVYGAVHPSLRRQGLGRALAGPALGSGAVLRSRVPDDARAGLTFLRGLGFCPNGARLLLRRTGPAPGFAVPALRIRPAGRGDLPAIEKLSAAAWKDAPEAFAARPGDLDRFFGRDGLLLLAECNGMPAGYLAATRLGSAIAIEELAVLPDLRRSGAAKALVASALAQAGGAVLSVAEANRAARALYRSLGFSQAARFVMMERRPS